jgi:hypothetical protein
LQGFQLKSGIKNEYKYFTLEINIMPEIIYQIREEILPKLEEAANREVLFDFLEPHTALHHLVLKLV